MNIRGIHKTSLIDFPGKISSVLFSGGCNLRCGYCHNPELACNSLDLDRISNDDAFDFINKRKDLIDGISISGGEPTLSKNIDDFIHAIKKMKLAVKIDTNGLSPDVIERLLEKNLLDYAAVDMKTSPQKYSLLTGTKVDFNRIRRTVDILKASGIDYELRTTCIPHFVTIEDFADINKSVGRVKNYYLQQFVNEVTLDLSMSSLEPYPLTTLRDFQNYVSTFSGHCGIRGI
jgi:pyruvate formate lyase activating enzyme